MVGASRRLEEQRASRQGEPELALLRVEHVARDATLVEAEVTGSGEDDLTGLGQEARLGQGQHVLMLDEPELDEGVDQRAARPAARGAGVLELARRDQPGADQDLDERGAALGGEQGEAPLVEVQAAPGPRCRGS